MSLRNADSAKKVLNSTFLVQEYVEGGNLRKQVLAQVPPVWLTSLPARDVFAPTGLVTSRRHTAVAWCLAAKWPYASCQDRQPAVQVHITDVQHALLCHPL